MNLNWWAVGGVALLGAYAWRAVTSLNVEEVTLGPYVVLYIRAKGPYHTAVPRAMRKLTRMIVTEACLEHESQENLMNTLGVYYDGPKVTRPSQCHSIAAYCVDMHGATDGSGYAADLQSLSVVKTGELSVGHIPQCRALMVQLPFSGWSAILAALFCAYPLLIKTAAKRLGTSAAAKLKSQGFIELYHPRTANMSVALPLAMRDDVLPL